MAQVAVVAPKQKTNFFDTLWQHLWSEAAFFWFVTFVFMAVSVAESGDYFSGIISNNVFGILGYASACVIDLIAVVSMKARLRAKRMHDAKGEHLYLVGVLVCAGLSAFANVTTALAHYHADVFPNAPHWIQIVAPWTGVAFPLLIVLISVTADHVLDESPSEKIKDVDEYRRQQEKHVKVLEVRRDIAQQVAKIEQEIHAIESVSVSQRAWFQLHRKQVRQLPVRDTVSREEVAHLLHQQQEQFTQQLTLFSEQVQVSFSHLATSLYTQLDTDATLLAERLDALKQWNTDALPVVGEGETPEPETRETVSPDEATQSTSDVPVKPKQKSTTGDAAKKVRRLLKQYPDATPSEIAKRAGVSRTYVNKIRAEMQQQVSQSTSKTQHENSNHNGHAPHLNVDELVPLEV